MTYMMNGHVPKIPDGLLVFAHDGDYGGRVELFLEGTLVFECWTFVRILKLEK
jgi:hypothetical protein